MHVSIALLLGIVTVLKGTLARPILNVESIAIRDSFGLHDASNSVDLRSLDQSEVDLERRGGQPYPAKNPKKPKITSEAQKTRKAAVKQDVQQKQAANELKKTDLQKKAAQFTGTYGKPRPPKKQPKVELSKKGKALTPPGYRARGRAAGARLEKQPKTPKRDMKKGDPKSDKALRTQQEATARAKARKAAGRDNFKAAAAAQKKTKDLPDRKATFSANGKTYTGKDVRTAVFNGHHFEKNPVNFTPKPFNNDLQGPADHKTRPLPNMVGGGGEFPVTKDSNGYQGKGAIGTTRAIVQPNSEGGHTFKGVIAHDESRDKKAPGYNDHFEVPAHVPAPHPHT